MQRAPRSLTAIVLVVALVVAACGGAVAPAESDIGVALEVLPAVEVAPTTTSSPDTTTTTVGTSTTAAPDDPSVSWIATAHDDVEHLEAFDAPNGEELRLPYLVPNPHQFGGPLTLMVTEGGPGDTWVKVQIPLRPNGREGWIRTDRYDLTSTQVRAEVLLSESRVVVYDGESIIAESEAVIGADDSPTPLGTYFVAAKRRNPDAEAWLGPWALVLSSYSEAFETFSGALPVIALHGTDRPDQLGEAITNGCVRIPNEVISLLANHVPLGAPVTVLS